VILDVDSFRSG